MNFRQRLLIAALPLVAAASAMAAPAAEPVVLLKTDMGDITVRLTPSRAPVTVKNFLQYVQDGHYNGTVFHRVIPGFMIQGGGFDDKLVQKPTRDPIPLEARGGLRNDKYTIAMARTSYPHSATSQFYINVNDNSFLNADEARDGYGYCVFGQVIKGTDTVDRIAGVTTGVRNGMGDVPVKPVHILSAEIVK